MSGWRLFFTVAAIFNFAAGLPLAIAPAEMAASLGVPVPDDLMYHRFTGLLVACFGGVYALLASDPMRYRPVLWTGVIGKAGVVALFTEAFLGGRVPFQAYAVSVGDLAFVIGFLVFLLTTGKKAA
jgi:hypothetical protein